MRSWKSACFLPVFLCITAAAAPEPIDGFLARAGRLLASNRPDDAAAVYEEGLKAHPSSAELRKRLGHLLFRRRPLDPQAGELLGAAAKSATRDPEAHFLYGQWACVNHREELCVAELTRAASLPPSSDLSNMQIYTLIAMSEDTRNHTDRAEAAFRKALAHNLKLPRPDPVSAYRFAEFLIKESKEEEAGKLVERILQFAPGYSPALMERAKSLANEGHLDKAALEAESALRSAAGDKTQLRVAHAFLAKTYNALGKEDLAREHQRSVEELR